MLIEENGLQEVQTTKDFRPTLQRGSRYLIFQDKVMNRLDLKIELSCRSLKSTSPSHFDSRFNANVIDKAIKSSDVWVR
jgi:hypothetical protein